MDKVKFGDTGLEVTRLGVGLAEIGSELSMSEVDQAGSVLNSALDAGINFLDTAACYGISEELIGKTVAHRRDEFHLATKAGHARGDGLGGEGWTYETVRDSIDRSLRRMKTDHVETVQLHSCGIDVLERGDAIRALEDARDAGKTRFVGYSGDNEDAHWAVASGAFQTLQTSFNLVEQRAHVSGLLDAAKRAGMGVIVKRPIGGGAWGRAKAGASGSVRAYDDEYFRRSVAMQAEGEVCCEHDDPIITAMGFTFAHPEVHVAIVGTKNPAHMASNIASLPAALEVHSDMVDVLHERFARLDSNWRQLT